MEAEHAIEITFNPDGTVNIEGFDFEGTGCDAAMEFLEKGLGEVAVRTNKPEYTDPPKIRRTTPKQRTGQEGGQPWI